MKLIQRTNRNFLGILLSIVPLASIGLFFLLNLFIHNEVDEKLRVDEKRIIEQLKSGASVKSVKPIFEVSVTNNSSKELSKIRNARVYDPIEKEMEPFRELLCVKKINNEMYSIVVRQATIEAEDLLFVVIFVISGVFLLLFVVLFILNARISKKIWKPFQFNLSQLHHFSLKSGSEIELQDASIDEFKELNTSLVQMTSLMNQDYRILKEFTENASHEIQTPLAIMSLNLEEIIQEDLPEKTLAKVYTVFQSTQRLSKLNEKLLLLAKLDNQQYTADVLISLNSILEKQLEDFQPFFENRQIIVSTSIESSLQVQMDSVLANILIANLLSNAVKYNREKGNISLSINSERMLISNATDQNIDCNLIFNRFKKGTDTVDSTGLGLSIVKKISELSKLQISASLTDGIFQIILKK